MNFGLYLHKHWKDTLETNKEVLWERVVGTKFRLTHFTVFFYIILIYVPCKFFQNMKNKIKFKDHSDPLNWKVLSGYAILLDSEFPSLLPFLLPLGLSPFLLQYRFFSLPIQLNSLWSLLSDSAPFLSRAAEMWQKSGFYLPHVGLLSLSGLLGVTDAEKRLYTVTAKPGEPSPGRVVQLTFISC